MEFLLAFGYVLLFLFLLMLACLPFTLQSTIKNICAENDYRKGEVKHSKTAILFGGTGKRAEDILAELTDYNIVICSRRVAKFEQLKQNYPHLSWRSCDVRINREVSRVIKEVKEEYGSVDLIVNISLIETDLNLYNHYFSIERDDKDIIIKLPGAYKKNYRRALSLYHKGSPGSESHIFTNMFGTINITRAAVEEGVSRVHHLTTKVVESDLYLATLKELIDDNVTTTAITYGSQLKLH